MNLFFILICLLVFLIIIIVVRDRVQRQKTGYLDTEFDEKFPKINVDYFGDQEQQFQFNRNVAEKYGKTYRQWIFGLYLFNIIRASEVEKIITSQKQLGKTLIYQFLQPFLRNGLLTNSDGPKWMKHRKILTPAFHFNILLQFYTVFQEEAEDFITKIGESTNLTELVPLFTINVLSETAMGVKQTRTNNGKSESEVYREGIYEIGEMLVFRAFRPWLLSDFTYKLFGYKNKLDKILDPVHNFTKSVIKKRRNQFLLRNQDSDFYQNDENIYETKKRRYAMLDTLLAAERDGLIDSEEIKDEVDTFMFAGHDTTSAGIIFILFLLGQHPEAQEQILEELNQVKETSGSEKVSFKDLSNMKYLDRVIKECLRIYPPVPIFARKLSEEVDYDGLKLPAGTFCNFHVFDIHRDPEQFPDPEKFDPDRFLPENIAKRHPFAYIPFSAGPRNCIGQKFALLEVKTLLTTILPKFKIIPVTRKENLVFMMDMVLRTRDPVKVTFQPRN